MRNIRHFVFYIPNDSAEVVDVLPMFDKDLKPLAEDHTDLQLNYDTLTPLPYLKGLLAECSENGEIEPFVLTSSMMCLFRTSPAMATNLK